MSGPRNGVHIQRVTDELVFTVYVDGEATADFSLDIPVQVEEFVAAILDEATYPEHGTTSHPDTNHQENP